MTTDGTIKYSERARSRAVCLRRWRVQMRRAMLWLMIGLPWNCLARAEQFPPRAEQVPRPAPPAAVTTTAARPGSDWPCFLGPTGDSKSSERGILTNWPADGPPLVWQLPLGTGYGMPTVKEGRLFQFDRAGNQARLARARQPHRASRSGRSSIPATSRICTATTTARAARRWSTAIGSTLLAPRACCTA